MGRTLPSITQAFLQEQQSLSKFRRALRMEDQRALDDLLAPAALEIFLNDIADEIGTQGRLGCAHCRCTFLMCWISMY